MLRFVLNFEESPLANKCARIRAINVTEQANSTHSSIFLIGMPGAGKSTIGKALAKRLSLKFIDADKEMVSRTGVPIATIFEIEGEAGFRAREVELIAELATRPGLVLATGGGAILNADNRRLLRESGAVVYLRASLAKLFERTQRDAKRPLLQGVDAMATLTQLLAVREPLYSEVAHITVESGHGSVSKLVESIVQQLIERGFWGTEA